MTSKNYSKSREARPADFIIKIHGYQNRIIAGDIEFVPTGENISFYGLTSLLETVQDKLDECGYPQATMAMRSWDLHKPAPISGFFEEPAELSPADMKGRVLASFMLRIQFRQNAGWQGSLAWLEGRCSVPFRSVLEMSVLLDQAVQHSTTHSRATPATRQSIRWRTQESVS